MAGVKQRPKEGPEGLKLQHPTGLLLGFTPSVLLPTSLPCPKKSDSGCGHVNLGLRETGPSVGLSLWKKALSRTRLLQLGVGVLVSSW